MKHVSLQEMHQHIRDIKLIIFSPFRLMYVFAFYLLLFIEVKLNWRLEMKKEPSVKKRERNWCKKYILSYV